MAWDLDEAISSIESAASIDELTAVLQKIAENFGFSSYTFIDALRPGDDNPIVITTVPGAWARSYRSEGFVHVDPIISTWRRTNISFDWSSVKLPKRAGKRIPGPLKTMMAAWDHGFREGLVVPFHYVDSLGRAYSSAVTFFWTDTLARFRFALLHNRSHLHVVMLYWAQRVVDLSEQERRQRPRFRDVSPELPEAISLTDRERDVLSWAARGKTVSDTADILRISQDTVETHIRNAMKKLSATNKTHAVVKALYLNLIDI